MIPIVKPYLPPIEKYQKYLEGVYQRNWLTNRAPLVQELEVRLAEYLGVDNLMLVANGTLALQVAYRALGLETGEAITTPFTFAATPSSLLWQNIQPRFVDIDRSTLNIDPELIESRVNSNTKAIVPVHVFGNPCEVEQIEAIAQKHRLKVVYDAAHAFGSNYKGKSLLTYGDAATISLHATKIFHCVEGGAVVFKCKDDLEKARQLINFGFDSDNQPEFVGTNAKMSEVHAAMGLAMLDDIDAIIENRKAAVAQYQHQLKDHVVFQTWSEHGKNNGAYAPVLLDNKPQLLGVMQALKNNEVQSRRYFSPNLSNVTCYRDVVETPIADSIANRVLCLPLYYHLKESDLADIARVIRNALVTE